MGYGEDTKWTLVIQNKKALQKNWIVIECDKMAFWSLPDQGTPLVINKERR